MFSVFVRLDLLMHVVSYFAIAVEASTYDWYLFNWKRKFYLRKALLKRISKSEKESVVNSDEWKQTFGQMDEDEIE